MKTAVLALVLLAIPAAAQPVDKAGFGPSRTLSDIAKERRLGVLGVPGGTFSVTGASGMPVLLAPVYGEGGSFEEVDRDDAAHRPAPSPILYDPYLPNYWSGGYRSHAYRPVHRAPPIVTAPPAPVAPQVAPRPAPHSTSGRTGGSGRRR